MNLIPADLNVRIEQITFCMILGNFESEISLSTVYASFLGNKILCIVLAVRLTIGLQLRRSDGHRSKVNLFPCEACTICKCHFCRISGHCSHNVDGPGLDFLDRLVLRSRSLFLVA